MKLFALRDRGGSILVEVLRTFGLFAVPVVLLPFFLMGPADGFGLMTAGLVILGLAFAMVICVCIAGVIFSQRCSFGSSDPPPDMPPQELSGKPAPLNPMPTLVTAAAKKLPADE